MKKKNKIKLSRLPRLKAIKKLLWYWCRNSPTDQKDKSKKLETSQHIYGNLIGEKKKLQLLISEKTMEYVSVEITYLYVKNFILHTKSN